MNIGQIISAHFIACFVALLRGSYGNNVRRGVEIVTYGEPCVATRELPIRIEGPKPPQETEKIPLSMDFRVVSDMFVKPRRTEYPISIQVPETTPPPCEEIRDPLKGRSYGYNTYVPPEANLPTPLKNYNFGVDVPVSVRGCTAQESNGRVVEKLRGLTSRIDRVLVPACEVSSSPYQC